MRLTWLVALVCGCGRIEFDPTASAVDAQPSCWNRWLAGDVTFSDVRRLDELTGTQRVDPSLSPDDTELFFAADGDLYATLMP